MLGWIAFVLGAAWGAWVARRRGGNWLDMLQYGAVWGVILGLIAIFASVWLMRSAMV